MALTKKQKQILARANSRAAALIAQPWAAHVPAVQFLEDSTRNNRFTAATLAEAKRFLRYSSSTITGARKAAHEAGLYIPPKRPQALTATERRNIDVANKRLQELRARGANIPAPYNQITRFNKSTAQIAAQFLDEKWSTQKKRKGIYKRFSADFNREINQLVKAYQYSKMAEAYYDDLAQNKIPEDTRLDDYIDERRRRGDIPSVTGEELAAWVRQGGDTTTKGRDFRVRVGSRAYDRIAQYRGAEKYGGDMWQALRDSYWGSWDELPAEFRARYDETAQQRRIRSKQKAGKL